MKLNAQVDEWAKLLKRTNTISRYNKPEALKLIYMINDLVRDHWGSSGNGKAGRLYYDKRGYGLGQPESERDKTMRRMNRLDLV